MADIKDFLPQSINGSSNQAPPVPLEGIQASSNMTEDASADISDFLPISDNQIYAQGLRMGRTRPFDLQSYEKYNTFVNPNLPRQVLDEQRALSQSTFGLIGKSGAQFLGTVAGQIVSGVGSILNIPQTVFRLIQSAIDMGNPEDWDGVIKNGLGGEFQELGIGIEEGIREALPIYQTQRAQQGGFGGGLGDGTWWASMFPTVGSALASFVPMLGTIKGISSTGKVLTGLNKGTRVGRFANRVGGVIQDERLLNTAGALVGAHLDSMEEIARGYDEQFQYALDLGFNDEDAKRYAGEYASTAYQKAWTYGFIFNAIELNSILRGANKVAKGPREIDYTVRRNVRNIARQGIDAETTLTPTLTRAAKIKIGMRGLKDFISVGASEGLEEMRVDLALDEGEISARNLLGVYDARESMSQFERWKEYLSQTNNWDSFIWGFIGGGVAYGGRSIAQRFAYGEDRNKIFENLITTPTELIREVAGVINETEGDLSLKVNTTQITNEDGSTSNVISQNGVEAPILSILSPIFNNLADANAIEYGELYLDEIAKLDTQTFEEIYGSNKRELITNLRKEFAVAKNIYRKNSTIRRGNKYDNVFNNKKSSLEYQKDYLQRELLNIQNKIRIAALDGNERKLAKYDYLKNVSPELSTIDNNIETNSEDINIINNRISNIQNEIENFQNTSEYRAIIERRNNIQNQLNNSIVERNQLTSDIRLQNRNYRINSQDSLNNIGSITLETLREQRSQIDELINNRRLLNNRIRRERRLLNKELTNTTVIEGEIENRNDIVNSLQTTISQKQQIVDENQRLRNQFIESHPDISAIYNRENSEIENASSIYNVEIESLLALQESIKSSELQIDSVLRDFERTFVPNTTQKFDRLTELETEELNNQEENQTIASEESTTNVETSQLSDIDNINYTVDIDNNLIGFVFNNKKYEIGDQIEAIYQDNAINNTISSIDLIDNRITIGLNNNQDSIIVNDLQSADNIDFEIYDGLIERFADTDAISNNFEKVLNDLNSYMNNTQYKQNFIRPTNNNEILNARIRSLNRLINAYLSTAQELQDNSLRGLISSTIQRLQNDSVINQNHIKIADLNNYFNEQFNIVSPTNSSELNNFVQNSITQPFISNLVNSIEGYFTYINSEFIFGDLKDIYKVQSIFNNKFNEYIENILSETKRLYSTENIDNLLLTLQENKNNFDIILKNSENTFVNQVVNIWTDILQNNNLDNITDSVIEQFSNFNSYPINDISKIQILKDLSQQLIQQLNDYRRSKLPITPSILDEIQRNINLVSDILDFKNINQVPQNKRTNSLVSEAQELSKFGLFSTISAVNNSYLFLNSIAEEHYEAEYFGDNLKNTLQRVSQIEVEDLDNPALVRDETALRTSINYFVAPIYQEGFRALSDFVDRYLMFDMYSANHKITFDEILNEIYQAKDGDQLIWDYYYPIFNSYRLATQGTFIDSILNDIRGLDDAGDTINYINNIKQHLAPFQSIYSSPYRSGIDSTGNITDRYIKQFIKNTARTEYTSRERSGLIIENIIDSVVKQSDIYDVDLSSVRNGEIEIDGTLFTIEEIQQAKEELYIGKPLTQTINSENNIIKLYTKINNKNLLVGQINLSDTNNFHGLPLLKNEEYNSAFGNNRGLSNFIITLINATSLQPTTFNLIKDYYTTYVNNSRNNNLTDESVQNNLIETLNKIKVRNQSLYNAIINASNYNTEFEDTDTIDTSRVNSIFEPIFYRIVFESLGDYHLNKRLITFKYNNLNTKLNNNILTAQNIFEKVRNNPNSNINISHISKASLNFANNRNIRNNVLDSVKPTLPNNTLNIITTQEINGSKIISSLTNNQQLVLELSANETRRSQEQQTDLDTLNRLRSDDNHYQLYVETRAFAGEHGASYSPLQRGTLISYRQNNPIAEEYTNLANQFVSNTLQQFISEAELFNHTQAENNADGRIAQLSNRSTNLVNDLSEVIITDDNRNSKNQLRWFNVSRLQRERTGNYSKNIEFITTDRRYNVSYGNEIKVFYRNDGNTNNPNYVLINVSFRRVRTKAGRYAQLNNKGDKSWQPGLPLKANTGLEQIRADTYTAVKINSLEDIQKLFSSKPVTDLLRNLNRSIPTVYNKNSYTFTSNATGESFGRNINENNYKEITDIGEDNVVRRKKLYGDKYKSVVFEWGRQNNLTDNNPTFNGLQDFYLRTNAVTTGLSPIRTSDGNILTNYQVDTYTPPIYINTELESIDTFEPSTQDMELTLAKDMIELISSESSNRVNPLNYISRNNVIPKENLIQLGIINSETSDAVYNEINRFITSTFNDSGAAVILIDNLERLNQIEQSSNLTEYQFDNTYMAYSPNQNAIYVFPKSFGLDSSKALIGRNLLHELLHLKVDYDIKNQRLSEEVKTELDNIINELRNIDQFENNRFDLNGLNNQNSESLITGLKNNVKELLNKLDEDGSTAYTELISFVFTNPAIANTLNRITSINNIENTQESFWNKLLRSILKLIGIDINESSIAQDIINVISNNTGQLLSISSPTGRGQARTIRRKLLQSTDISLAPVGEMGELMQAENSTDNVLNLEQNLLSYNSTQSVIDSFKSIYKDNTNLKIC